MKTQCPSCKYIFKVPDEYNEKKAKCVKCKQPFTIVKLVSPPNVNTIKKKEPAVKPKPVIKNKVVIKRGYYLCKACGFTGKPKKVTKGSFFIEIVLWLSFLLPGLIYTLWRLTTTYKACRVCNSGDIIPANSIMGTKILAEQENAMVNSSPSNKKGDRNIIKRGDRIIIELEKLGELKEKGILTTEEFKKVKTRLLSK